MNWLILRDQRENIAQPYTRYDFSLEDHLDEKSNKGDKQFALDDLNAIPLYQKFGDEYARDNIKEEYIL